MRYPKWLVYSSDVAHVSDVTDQSNKKPGDESSVSARVSVIREVAATPEGSEWRLCLQWCRYVYDDGTDELGYRFIWRRPNGHLQAARGQARLPSRQVVEHLFNLADEAGWSNLADGSRWEGVR